MRNVVSWKIDVGEVVKCIQSNRTFLSKCHVFYNNIVMPLHNPTSRILIKNNDNNFISMEYNFLQFSNVTKKELLLLDFTAIIIICILSYFVVEPVSKTNS